jgi:hypothetical protein
MGGTENDDQNMSEALGIDFFIGRQQELTFLAGGSAKYECIQRGSDNESIVQGGREYTITTFFGDEEERM